MKLPARGRINVDDGVDLYFEASGQGPTTILFPNGIQLMQDLDELGELFTFVLYDLRNRGSSSMVNDTARLQRGIHNDVDDLDAVRRHFGLGRVNVIGHSYVGLMVALYAMKYPAHTQRVVQIGPMQYEAAKQYPPQLSWDDGTLADVFAQLGRFEPERLTLEPAEGCRRVWSILTRLYVVDPADAGDLGWGRCELPNERAFMRYWSEHILPSIHALALTTEDFAKAMVPILTIHGRKDRSAPYGGGRDWAMALPDARLRTLDDAAHAPWIETPEEVFSAIEVFFSGAWPKQAEKVIST